MSEVGGLNGGRCAQRPRASQLSESGPAVRTATARHRTATVCLTLGPAAASSSNMMIRDQLHRWICAAVSPCCPPSSTRRAKSIALHQSRDVFARVTWTTIVLESALQVGSLPSTRRPLEWVDGAPSRGRCQARSHHLPEHHASAADSSADSRPRPRLNSRWVELNSPARCRLTGARDQASGTRDQGPERQKDRNDFQVPQPTAHIWLFARSREPSETTQRTRP
jgi:hypothetical protein